MALKYGAADLIGRSLRSSGIAAPWARREVGLLRHRRRLSQVVERAVAAP